MSEPRRPPPPKSRWTSFVADGSEPRPRTLHEEANPAHRLRVEHNRDTILIHLSAEDGHGWTVFAVDRSTRRCAVATARRQLDAARQAFDGLYLPRASVAGTEPRTGGTTDVPG